jgi:myosin heavy subunit
MSEHSSDEEDVVYGLIGIYNKKGNLYHKMDITKASFLLGSDQLACDIKIKNNDEISPIHAEIYLKSKPTPRLFIKRVHNKDVILLNKRYIEDAELHDQDEIIIGEPPRGKKFTFYASKDTAEKPETNIWRRKSSAVEAKPSPEEPQNKKRKIIIKQEVEENDKKRQRLNDDSETQISTQSVLSPPLERLIGSQHVEEESDEEEDEEHDILSFVDELAQGFELAEKLSDATKQIKKLEKSHKRKDAQMVTLQNENTKLETLLKNERDAIKEKEDKQNKRLTDLAESHNNVINLYREKEFDMLKSIETLRVEKNKMEITVGEQTTEIEEQRNEMQRLRDRIHELEQQAQEYQQQHDDLSTRKQGLEELVPIFQTLQSKIGQLVEKKEKENNAPQTNGSVSRPSSPKAPKQQVQMSPPSPPKPPVQAEPASPPRTSSISRSGTLSPFFPSNLKRKAPAQPAPVIKLKKKQSIPIRGLSKEQVDEIEQFSSPADASLELLNSLIDSEVMSDDTDIEESQLSQQTPSKRVRFKNIDFDEPSVPTPSKSQRSDTSFNRDEIYGNNGNNQNYMDEEELTNLWRQESHELEQLDNEIHQME